MCHATAVSSPVPHPLPLHSLRAWATMFITPPPAARGQLFVLDWIQSLELTDKLPDREDTEVFRAVRIATTVMTID